MKEELENKIIAVAYGDANLLDKLKIRKLAEKDSEVRKLLTEYSRTAQGVHSLKMEKYPAERLPKYARQSEKRNLLSDLFEIYVKRPAVSAAVVSTVIVVILSSIVFNLNGNNQRYTQKELNAAEYQVKKSLAIVSEVFNQTQSRIKEDVLKTRVKGTIREGFNKFAKIIKEGDKR